MFTAAPPLDALFLAAPTLQQSSGTPLWVLLIILLLLILLFWWGLTRNNIPAEEDVHSAADDHDRHEQDLVEAEMMMEVAEEMEEEPAEEPIEDPEVVADDLKQIEGIGPKTEQYLKEHGVHNFSQLAAADPAELKHIIQDVAGYKMIDPTSWPQQAQLAADGDWDGLRTLQDQLIAGRA